MINVKQFTINHFGVNCYILSDVATHQCAIVDPGAEASYEDAQLTQYIEAKGLTPVLILLTHAHVDHIAGLRQMCERYNLPVSLHEDGTKLLRQAEVYGSVMGFSVSPMHDLPTQFLSDNQQLSLGESRIECRFCPGHCPGSLCYVLHDEKMVLTGDALFRMSIGRTDLPGGNYDELIAHLQSRILTLDDEYQILPGHGDLSTIGEEHLYNGFLS